MPVFFVHAACHAALLHVDSAAVRTASPLLASHWKTRRHLWSNLGHRKLNEEFTQARHQRLRRKVRVIRAEPREQVARKISTLSRRSSADINLGFI